MALRYEINENLIPLSDGQEHDPKYPLIEVLTEAEFLALGNQIDDNIRTDLAQLAEAESCYVDVYPQYIIGSMAVPDKKDLMGDRNLFSYFWRPDRIVFIDEGHLAKDTMERVADSELDVKMTTAFCLYSFMRELVLGDPTWLGELEDQMEDAEDALLDNHRNIPNEDLSKYRRITVRMSTYYEQLATVALELSGNDNRLMTSEEAANFEQIMNSADRLESRAETIREYSLTLRELHQAQIDVAQNNTMQLLTIVTVLIAPLSLMAGWFGMNFTNIPGVNTTYGFYVITAIGVVITLGLIFWFRRKKWL